MGEKRSAILYFAYRPEKEAIRKPLMPEFGHDVNVKLYRLMQSQVSDVMAPTGLPVFHIDDTEQVGESFGERLCNAAETIFKKGFDQLIILGNDAYGLKTDHVMKALENVKAGKTCLMPSNQGGALVIGMSKKHYRRALWLELPWCTPKLFHELFDCLPQCGILGEAMLELNTATDIHEMLVMKGELTELAFYVLTITGHSLSETPLEDHRLNTKAEGAMRFRGPPYLA
jgi:hypothetical protein